jgi:hypothetical protein
MTCDVHAEGTIELYFYGELPAVAREEVEAHLVACRDCRQALDDLAVIRAALAARPDVAAPPAGDWSRFMARLDDSIAPLRREPNGSTPPQRKGTLLTMPGRSRVVSLLAIAALLAIVTIGVVTILRQRSAVPEGPAVATERVVDAPSNDTRSTTDPALLAVSDQHFERSKLVILGLATRDATAGEGGWEYERDLAETLLGDTRLYRRAAEERGMTTLAGVMQDLELVLLQTSMAEASDAESLEQLQRLIRRRDLLTKMNAAYTSGL